HARPAAELHVGRPGAGAAAAGGADGAAGSPPVVPRVVRGPLPAVAARPGRWPGPSPGRGAARPAGALRPTAGLGPPRTASPAALPAQGGAESVRPRRLVGGVFSLPRTG